MIEPEIAFADLADDADLAERFLKYIFKAVLDRTRRRHEVLRRAHREGRASPLDPSSTPTFVRMDYTEAITMLQKVRQDRSSSTRSKWGMDLQTEHERYLTESTSAARWW
jgi:asparaginyl-tRNA synthetase